MRQLAETSRKEKLAYAEEVIKLLDMEDYADSIVGVPGEGLTFNACRSYEYNWRDNRSQRWTEEKKINNRGWARIKAPTVTLPWRAQFWQTSWSILDLLEKLPAHGQAILCTIHQPSTTLLQRFGRVLFLGPNGKPAYFGELGPGCKTLTQYFERNGAVSCPPKANPAEYMMEITGCASGTESEIDWPKVWRSSPEFTKVHRELEYMERTLQKTEIDVSSNNSE